MKRFLVFSLILSSVVSFGVTPSPLPTSKPSINQEALFNKSTPPTSSNSESYEEALCGKKPTTLSSADGLDKLKSLEKEMPPVSDQKNSQWCYAFSACDLYDYNFHISKNPREPYSDSNRISPIDAVGASTTITGSKVLDFNEGGFSIDVLEGLKKKGKARSKSQLYMGDISAPDPATRAYIQGLMSKYNQNSTGSKSNQNGFPVCLSSSNNIFELKQKIEKQMHGVLAVSKFLFDAEVASGENTDDLKVYHYQDKVKSIQSAISLPNVSTQDFMTADLNSYFTKLKDIANEKQPASISLCADDLKSSGTKSSDGCGRHTVTFVGAAYVAGKCSVRIRNSWGEGWGENGYRTLTVDELVSSLKHRMQIPGEKSYQISWLSPKSTVSARTMDDVIWNIKEGNKFSGTAKRNTNGTFSALNGTVRYADGRSVDYSAGKMVKVVKFKLDNGKIYTGPVIDQNDGTFRVPAQ